MTNEATALKPVQTAVEVAFAKHAERLEAEGVLLPAARKFRIGLTSLVPLALVLLVLAFPRLMGLEAKKPVEYLTGMMIVGGLLGLAFTLAGSLRLSNRGQALLAKQKERHESLKTGTQWEHGGEAGMAVALFGTAVLTGTAIAPLQTWYPRQTGEASSSGCGGSAGGSGCGAGDGGGGGGCGGGGCGGGD